jgi:hypothetical protein
VGQRLVQPGAKRLEIARHLLGFPTKRDVVFPGIEHHQPWIPRSDQLVEIVNAVRQLRATNPAVEDRQARKILFQRLPNPNRGAAGEDDRVARRRLGGILPDDRGDFDRPFFRRGFDRGQRRRHHGGQTKIPEATEGEGKHGPKIPPRRPRAQSNNAGAMKFHRSARARWDFSLAAAAPSINSSPPREKAPTLYQRR